MSEQHFAILFDYVRNAAHHSFARRYKSDLVWYLEDLDPDVPSEMRPGSDGTAPTAPIDESWKKLLEVVRRKSSRLRRDTIAINTGRLSKALGLTEVDYKIIELLGSLPANPTLDAMGGIVLDSVGSPNNALAALLGREPHMIARRLAPGAPLKTLGIVEISDSHDEPSLSDAINVTWKVQQALSRRHKTDNDLLACLIGQLSPPKFSVQNFQHHRQEVDIAVGLLRSMTADPTAGMNILIHGDYGVGKTELSKTIAEAAGFEIYRVGETENDGDEPTRKDRLASLRLSQALLQKRKKVAILFDEMEDAVVPRAQNDAGPIKAWINNLLQTNRVPVIWTANATSLLGNNLLRRMSQVIEMRTPPLSVRAGLWQSSLAAHGFPASPAILSAYARHLPIQPSIIATAVETAARSRSSIDAIPSIANGLLTAMTGQPPIKIRLEPPFDISLVRADGADLNKLTAKLAEKGSRHRYSILASGGSGTGKSAWLRHVAELSGLEPMPIRFSKIASKWAHETEQNICRLFQEAERASAFLIFDEGDALIASRATAERNHEINETNEMLNAMAEHPLPFGITTNLLDRPDAASFRRFTFKLVFLPLAAPAAIRAFERFFGRPPNPQATSILTRLEGLTPGNFSVVRDEAEIMDELDDDSAIIERLREELRYQNNGGRHRIGFEAA